MSEAVVDLAVYGASFAVALVGLIVVINEVLIRLDRRFSSRRR